MNNNILKLIAVTLLVFVLIGMMFAKYYLPNLDTSLINSILLQLLTGLGVYNLKAAP